MRAMWAIFRAAALDEWRRLRHDRWDAAMISVVPMLTVLLIWWFFSAGLALQLPIGLIDQDHSALSRQAVRMLQAAPGLRIKHQFDDMRQAETALRAGEIHAVVLIPDDLERNVKTGRPATIALLHNAQWSLYSGLIQRDVRMAVGTLSAGIEIAVRNRRGQPLWQARSSFTPIRTEMTGLFNVSSNYQIFLATSLMPALLHILAMTAGAWAMGRKLRDHDMEHWLRHAVLEQTLPFSKAARASMHDVRLSQALAALLGKTVWTMLGMMAAASVAFTLMTTRLHAEPLSWAATWCGIYLLVLISVAMGLLAAAVTLSLRMALSATGFITAPAFAYSGVAFPLMAMPAGARFWAMVLPLTWYLELQTRMLQMDAPPQLALPVLAGLLLATVVLLVLTAAATLRASRTPHRWGGR